MRVNSGLFSDPIKNSVFNELILVNELLPVDVVRGCGTEIKYEVKDQF